MSVAAHHFTGRMAQLKHLCGDRPGDRLTMSVSHHEKAFYHELKSRRISSFVAEDAGRVIGFITGGDERHGDDIYRGEIFTLYVLKNNQR